MGRVTIIITAYIIWAEFQQRDKRQFSHYLTARDELAGRCRSYKQYKLMPTDNRRDQQYHRLAFNSRTKLIGQYLDVLHNAYMYMLPTITDKFQIDMNSKNQCYCGTAIH